MPPAACGAAFPGRRLFRCEEGSLYYRVFDATRGDFLDCAGEFTAMPKTKTHKATKKRYKVTATGKVLHRGAGTSHLASRKSQKRKRNLRGTRTLHPVEARRIKKCLGVTLRQHPQPAQTAQ
jgi:large subunit ribosomal protein L35